MNIFKKIDAGFYGNKIPCDAQEGGEAWALLKADALKEARLTGHPKADKAFHFAFARHSNLREAVKCLCELAADVLL